MTTVLVLLRVVPLLLLLAGSAWLLWRSFVGLEWESRPRVRRMAWRRPGIGPDEVRRLAALQAGVQLTRAGVNPEAGFTRGQRPSTNNDSPDRSTERKVAGASEGARRLVSVGGWR
jgi:hypothetical protein